MLFMLCTGVVTREVTETITEMSRLVLSQIKKREYDVDYNKLVGVSPGSAGSSARCFRCRRTASISSTRC